jgi:hypothetical protein
MVLSDSNYFYDGSVTKNNSKFEVQASQFKSVEMPQAIERDSDENIIWGDYMRK